MVHHGENVLNEIERNLQDALQVARTVVTDPRLLPGGGATEMHVAVSLLEEASKIDGMTPSGLMLLISKINSYKKSA